MPVTGGFLEVIPTSRCKIKYSNEKYSENIQMKIEWKYSKLNGKCLENIYAIYIFIAMQLHIDIHIDAYKIFAQIYFQNNFKINWQI